MGIIIKASQLNKDVLEKTTTPIILGSYPAKVARLIEDVKYETFNLNIKLAEALLKIPQKQRAERANDEIMKIVSKCDKPIFLENYEMLFDPRYNVDAIRVFVHLSRRQKLIIKWCGSIIEDSLEYATLEHKDYRRFRIEDYDITCVI